MSMKPMQISDAIVTDVESPEPRNTGIALPTTSNVWKYIVLGVILLGVAFVVVQNRDIEPYESGLENGNATSPEGELQSRTFEFEIESLIGGGSGVVTIQTHPEWAPIGAKQFHDLIDAKFYDGCRFFRVMKDFIVQFGLNGDPETNDKWDHEIKDDPVKQHNTPGTVVFATAGPNTRTTQLFINTAKNLFLDSQGFAPFAEVISGMDVVKRIQDKYGETPDQGKIQKYGNKFLNVHYPDLSYIREVKEKGRL